MKAIDEVDSRRGRLVWAVEGGGGCGSEMVFRWAARVPVQLSEGFFYCPVNELTVRSSIAASPKQELANNAE